MEADVQIKLADPFEDSDIEWRLQHANEERGSGIAVPYVTNRAIQNRLDKTVGISNWKNEFLPWHGDGKKSAQLCGISIYFPERGEWITKYDGAEDSDIEPVKGGLSDSMKRAAVQWGIGRYLYEMDTVFVDIEKSGKTVVIKESSKAKLNHAHRSVIRRVFAAVKPSGSVNAPPESKPPPPPAATEKNPEPPPVPDKKPALQEPAPAQTKPAAVNGTYRVIDAVLQPSVRGVNTNLRLEGADGNILMVFMQGEDPGLVRGAAITNAVVTKKTRDGIVFNTLDSYTAALPGAA